MADNVGYVLGDAIPLTFTVADEDGAAATPGGYTLTVAHELGSSYDITGEVSVPVPGRYQADFAAPITGWWVATFTATGDYAGAETKAFGVSADDLAFITVDQVKTYLRNTSATDAELAQALATERVAQARHCEIDPYTEDLREALLCRVGRNIAARRTPAAQVNSFTGTTAGISTAAQYASEVERLEQPVRVVGFA